MPRVKSKMTKKLKHKNLKSRSERLTNQIVKVKLVRKLLKLRVRLNSRERRKLPQNDLKNLKKKALLVTAIPKIHLLVTLKKIERRKAREARKRS